MSLIWLCVQVCLMHQFLHFQSVSVHEPLPCFNVINHTIKTNNSSSAPRLFCPLYIKNKVLCSRCWSGSLRVTECPFVQSEEGALLSVFIWMCVYVLNDPWWGDKRPFEGARDRWMDGATQRQTQSTEAPVWPPPRGLHSFHLRDSSTSCPPRAH